MMRVLLLALVFVVATCQFSTASVVPPPHFFRLDDEYPGIYPALVRPYGENITDTLEQNRVFYDFSPIWSPLDPNGAPTTVKIEGCGFRKYTSAVCLFDFRFTSVRAWIADDNTIYCVLPRLTKEQYDFRSLPHNSRFDLVLDSGADTILNLGSFRWGPQVSCDSPISPSRGDTNGNVAVTITGEGFNDGVLTDLNVWFDDQAASGCSASADGTQITCSSIPESLNDPDNEGVIRHREIHREALVSITWGATSFMDRGAVECFLHVPDTFHYGPIIEDIEGCPYFGRNVGNLAGANETGTITLIGSGLADSAFGVTPLAPHTSATPGSTFVLQDPGLALNGTEAGDDLGTGRYLIEVTGNAPANRYDGTINTLQVFSSSVSDSRIEFEAPDFSLFAQTTNPENNHNLLFDVTFSVEVFYRQVNRLQSLGTFEFQYGPQVTHFGTETDENDRHWHAGGGDVVCAYGCGFDAYNETFEVDLVFESTTTSICNGTLDDLSVEEDKICCTLTSDVTCSGNVEVLQAFQVQFSRSTPRYEPSTSTELHQATIGPVFGALDSGAIPDPPDVKVNQGEVSFAGQSIAYGLPLSTREEWPDDVTVGFIAATPVDNTDNDWFRGGLTTVEAATSGNIHRYTDTSLNIFYNLTEFAATATIEITFPDADDGDCSYSYDQYWGPRCDSVQFHMLPIDGTNPLIVEGSNLGGFDSNTYYKPRMVLCDITRTDASTGSQYTWQCDTEQYENSPDLNVVSTTMGQNGASVSGQIADQEDSDFDDEDFNAGRRYWGQEFRVGLAYNSDRDGQYTGVTLFNFTDSNVDTYPLDNTPEYDSKALLDCGAVRFGPVTDAITPCVGSVDGDESFTLTLSADSDGTDSWYVKNVSPDRSESPHLTFFGSLLGDFDSAAEGTYSGTTNKEQTDYVYENVNVLSVFDACNMTAPVVNADGDEIKIYWGPRFPTAFELDEFPLELVTADTIDRDTGDVWGVHPTAEETLRMHVFGAAEFFPSGTGQSRNVRAIIDGERARSFVTLVSQNLTTIASNVTGTPVNVVVDTLTVRIPKRDFGTIATVCLEMTNDPFQPQTRSDRTRSDPFSGVNEEIQWDQVICAETKLHFEPKILGLSAGEIQPTAGDGADPIVNVMGLTSSWAVSNAFVGGYQVESIVSVSTSDDNDVQAIGTVQLELAPNTAEFNTDQSVRLEYFNRDEDNTANTDYYLGCENNTMHWIGWSPDTIHFGPTCGISTSPVPLSVYGRASAADTTEGTATLTVTGLAFECSDAHCTTGRTTPRGSEYPLCAEPQYSSELQYLGHQSDLASVDVDVSTDWPVSAFEARGTRVGCAWRQVWLYHEFDADTVPTELNPSFSQQLFEFVDSLDGSFNREFDVPTRNQNEYDCGKMVVAAYFPDALVSDESQRWVQCDGTVTLGIQEDDFDYDAAYTDSGKMYGYGYPTANLACSDSTTQADYECDGLNQLGGPRYSKLDDHLITISSASAFFNDIFFTNLEDGTDRSGYYRPQIFQVGGGEFGTQSLYPSSAGSGQHSTAVPELGFGQERSVGIRWTNNASLSDHKCSFDLGYVFHYGPIITGSTRDKCDDPVALNNPETDGSDQVAINGFALDCCGFQDVDDIGSDTHTTDTYSLTGRGFTRCYFATDATGVTPDQSGTIMGEFEWQPVNADSGFITCNIPSSNDPSKRQYGFGIAFGTNEDATAPTSICNTPKTNGGCTGIDSGTSTADYDLFLNQAEDGHFMDICYGPKLDQESIDLPMSGLDGCSEDPFTATLTGINFDDNDNVNVFEYVTFRWEIDDDTFNTVDSTDSFNTADTPLFKKECGEDLTGDKVYPVHNLTSNSVDSTYIESEFTYPDRAEGSAPSFESEGNEIKKVSINWGPTLTMADGFAASNGDFTTSGVLAQPGWLSPSEIRVWTQPNNANNNVEVTLGPFLEDWSCTATDTQFSQKKDLTEVMTLFGNRRSVAQTNRKGFDVQAGDFFTIGSSGSVTNQAVTWPQGRFGESGNIRALIDPHYDTWTFQGSSTTSHIDTRTAVLAGYEHPSEDDGDMTWHWRFATTGVSRTWTIAEDSSAIVVSGRGFAGYARALCHFGLNSTSSAEAWQADILSDRLVVCQPPPSQAPSSGALSLSLHRAPQDEDSDDYDRAFDRDPDQCDYDKTSCKAGPDTEIVTSAYTFVGVTVAFPLRGPVNGRTPVEITGFGLDTFSRMTCRWELATGPVETDLVDGVCESPQTNVQGLVTLTIVGYYWNEMGQESVFSEMGCFYFDYGYPTVTGVTPNFVFASESIPPTDVVVSGNFFNGGEPDSTVNGTGVYSCLWAVGADNTTDAPRDLGSEPDWANAARTNGIRVATTDAFGSPSYDIVCPLPSFFGRFGAYPFDIEFSNGERTGSNLEFDVLVSNTLTVSDWESNPSWNATLNDADEDCDPEEETGCTSRFFIDEFSDAYITLSGTGFFGGVQGNDETVSSYIVRFGLNTADAPTEDVVVYAVAEYSSNTDVVVPAISRRITNLTAVEEEDEEEEATKYVNFPVALSVDGGVSFSNDLQILYRSNPDLVRCLSPASSLTIVGTLALLVATIFALLF